MRTQQEGSGQEGPYYVYVLNTGVVGYHHDPDRRLNQRRRRDGAHVKMVWVSKPFPDRRDAEEHADRLKHKRDFEPPVFLRMCQCEYDQAGQPGVLIPILQAGANRYTLDLATGDWTRNGTEGR